MDPLTIAAGLAALYLLNDGSGSPLPDQPPEKKGARAVMETAAQCGVDQGWQYFLAAVAYHESRWHSKVSLGIASKLNRPDVKVNGGKGGAAESRAATQAYNRHVDDHGLWVDCGWGEDAYGFGSGGWYGLLPVFGLWPFRNTPARCLDPRIAIFDPVTSTIMAIAFAQRTMKRKTFKANPTWQNINRAWKSPGLMDGLPSETVLKVDERFDKSVAALDLPRDWPERHVSPLPAGWSAYETYKRLKGANA